MVLAMASKVIVSERSERAQSLFMPIEIPDMAGRTSRTQCACSINHC